MGGLERIPGGMPSGESTPVEEEREIEETLASRVRPGGVSDARVSRSSRGALSFIARAFRGLGDMIASLFWGNRAMSMRNERHSLKAEIHKAQFHSLQEASAKTTEAGATPAKMRDHLVAGIKGIDLHKVKADKSQRSILRAIQSQGALTPAQFQTLKGREDFGKIASLIQSKLRGVPPRSAEKSETVTRAQVLGQKYESIKHELGSYKPALDSEVVEAVLRAVCHQDSRVADDIHTAENLKQPTEKELSRLGEKVLNLQNLLSKESENVGVSDNHAVLDAMYAVLEDPTYQAVKEQQDLPLVKHMHGLCEAFYFKMEGRERYEAYVDHAREDYYPEGIREPGSLKELSDEVEGIVRQSRTYSYKKSIPFMLSHPGRTLHSLTGTLGTAFDPFKAGNHPMTSGTFSYRGGGEVIHAYAPSMTLTDRKGGRRLNPIAEGLLQSIENRRLSGVDDGGLDHLQVSTLQSMYKGTEKERTAEIALIRERYPLSASVQGWDFDHPMMSGKAYTGVKDPFPMIRERILGASSERVPPYQVLTLSREGPGMFFPDIPKPKMEEIINLVQGLYAGNESFARLSDERKGELAAQTVAIFCDQYSQQAVASQHSHIGKLQKCKQNIDRGAVANAMNKVVHLQAQIQKAESIEEKASLRKLMRQVVEEAVLVRAQAVDDRRIIDHRLEVLLSFLSVADEAKLGDCAIAIESLQADAPTFSGYAAYS